MFFQRRRPVAFNQRRGVSLDCQCPVTIARALRVEIGYSSAMRS